MLMYQSTWATAVQCIYYYSPVGAAAVALPTALPSVMSALVTREWIADLGSSNVTHRFHVIRLAHGAISTTRGQRSR